MGEIDINSYIIDYSNEQLGLEDEFDIICVESDEEAIRFALEDEKYDIIWSIFQIDSDYNEIKSIW